MMFAMLYRCPTFDQISVRIIETYDLLSPAVSCVKLLFHKLFLMPNDVIRRLMLHFETPASCYIVILQHSTLL